LGEQASTTAVFEVEVLTASELCGEFETGDEPFDVLSSLVVISVIPCDLTGANVIWEVYI